MLLKNFALVGGSTRSRISVQTGIKSTARINFMEIAPVLQDGNGCGFNAQGAVSLSQRDIETAVIKVNLDICPETLRGKYAEYLIRINAVEEGNKLPFEEYIMNYIIDSINDRIEKMMWQGDTAKTNDNTLKWIDGFLKLAGAEEGVIDVAIASGKTAYEAILDVYMAMPEGILDMTPEIYVSPAVFRKFVQEMVAKNWYQISVGAPQDEFILPGTDVKVVKTKGLAGTKNIVGTFAKNLYYGTDMEGDEEAIDLWYSQDDRVFKLEALWNSGVQIALPDMLVLATLAA